MWCCLDSHHIFNVMVVMLIKQCNHVNYLMRLFQEPQMTSDYWNHGMSRSITWGTAFFISPPYLRSFHKLPLCMAQPSGFLELSGSDECSSGGFPRSSRRGIIKLLCNIFTQNYECQYVTVKYMLIYTNFGGKLKFQNCLWAQVLFSWTPLVSVNGRDLFVQIWELVVLFH